MYIYMYIHTNVHDTGTLLDSGPGRKTHGSQQTQGSGRGGLGLGLVSERAVAIFCFLTPGGWICLTSSTAQGGGGSFKDRTL